MTSVKRENLANLMQIPRKFRLVNESETKSCIPMPHNFEPKDATDDYTKNQLILAIGAALPELATFVQEVDILRADNASACHAVAEMHRAAVGEYREPIHGVIADVDHLKHRFNQAMDVLRNIANNLCEASVMRTSANNFIETIRSDAEKGAGNVISMPALVNEKDDNGTTPANPSTKN